MNDDTESRLSTVPRCNLRNTYDETSTELPVQSSFWSKRPQNDIRSFTSSHSDRDFDNVISSTGSPYPNAIPTCSSPNLSPISSVTLECDVSRIQELLPVDSSMGLLTVSDMSRDDHSGILLPGIQYQSYNEVYTLSLDDGTSSTFHRTLYIPITLLDDSESSQKPEMENISEKNKPKEENDNDQNDQGSYESLEYTLGDFERTMATLLFPFESADNGTATIGECPNHDFFNPK